MLKTQKKVSNAYQINSTPSRQKILEIFRLSQEILIGKKQETIPEEPKTELGIATGGCDDDEPIPMPPPPLKIGEGLKIMTPSQLMTRLPDFIS